MNVKTSSRTAHGRCCAPICRALGIIGASTFLYVLATVILLTLSHESRADDNSQQPDGIANIYLETGFPNPTRLPGPFTGAVNDNQLLGATRFYNAGYTGTRAVMANIEAGYVWNGHETLAHVGLIPTSGASGEFDRHATAVGMLMGGRPTAVGNVYQT